MNPRRWRQVRAKREARPPQDLLYIVRVRPRTVYPAIMQLPGGVPISFMQQPPWEQVAACETYEEAEEITQAYPGFEANIEALSPRLGDTR